VTTPIPAGAAGTFYVDLASGTWTWSEQVFTIYGFAPGDVVPTTELVLSHQHAEDRAAVERFIQEAEETGRQTAIEQAKGALMMTYGLDVDEAFLLLRRYSQQVNVKLRDVARNITEALPDRDLPVGSRATWDQLADELRGREVEEQPGA
jgi:hypothetical protein